MKSFVSCSFLYFILLLLWSPYINTRSAHNTSSTSVRISWKPPPTDTIHGEFLGYRITYRVRDKQPEDIKEIYIRDSNVEVCAVINLNYDFVCCSLRRAIKVNSKTLEKRQKGSFFKFKSFFDVSASCFFNQSHEITNLETFTQYLVSLQVFNPEGLGPSSTVLIMTDEGSK